MNNTWNVYIFKRNGKTFFTRASILMLDGLNFFIDKKIIDTNEIRTLKIERMINMPIEPINRIDPNELSTDQNFIFDVSNQGRKHRIKIKASNYNDAADKVEKQYPDFDSMTLIK